MMLLKANTRIMTYFSLISYGRGFITAFVSQIYIVIKPSLVVQRVNFQSTDN
jgi:hypothetical protein